MPIINPRDFSTTGSVSERRVLELIEGALAGGGGGSGTGIRFELSPQTGSWFDLETNSVFGPFGIRMIADLGTFSINAEAEDVEIIAGRHIELTATQDVSVIANRDLNLTSQRDITLVAGPSRGIYLVNLPTAPGTSGQLWNSGGTVKVS